VTEVVPKPRHGGGIVALTATAANQDGVAVAEADARMLVSARAAAG
jgi:acyl dehydratase